MKGVRFVKAMQPWAPGATALLPNFAADLMIRDGFAVPHRFPDQPFAVDASAAPKAEPEQNSRPAPTYKTKRA